MSTRDAERSDNIRTRQLEEALKKAREADADQFDARAKVSDLRFLRLDALGESLKEIIAGGTFTNSFVTLRAIPTDPPRLIVDDSSHIVMEPDPRTYTFIHDGPDSRKVLLESEDKQEVEAKVTAYVAHRILELQRQSSGPEVAVPERKASGAGALALLMFWLVGVLMGAAGLYLYMQPEIIQAILDYGAAWLSGR